MAQYRNAFDHHGKVPSSTARTLSEIARRSATDGKLVLSGINRRFLAFEKKLELFSYAATLKNSDHRRAALYGLKKVDLTQLSSEQRAKYRTLRKMLKDQMLKDD